MEGLPAADVKEKVALLQDLPEKDSWETRVKTKDKFGKLLERLWEQAKVLAWIGRIENESTKETPFEAR